MSRAYHIDFMGKRKIFFLITALLILACVVLTPFRAKLDVSFAGGTMITYTYEGSEEAVDTNELATFIQGVIGKEVTVNLTTDMVSDNTNILVTVAGNGSLSSEKTTELHEKVLDHYAKNDQVKSLVVGETKNVNATMGTEFFVKCLVAVAVAFLLIIVYVAIRFRKIGGWSAGAAAIVALLTDICMVYGTFLVAGYTLDSNFIAVVLTILGYSVNDTIVIYDRVRENEQIYGKKKPIAELVNLSVNQTLARTLNTTITTIMAMIVVTIVALIFNIDTILRFSIPMLIGLISGTYSTIGIATGLWVTWKERAAKRKSKRQSA